MITPAEMLPTPDASGTHPERYRTIRTSEGRMKRFTALAVGADSFSIRILEAVLRRWSLNLISARHAIGLVELLAMHKPQLVLIDVEMPGVDSAAVVQRIRADAAMSGAVVLLQSSSDEASLAALARTAGADGYLPKSRDIRALEQRLERWLLH